MTTDLFKENVSKLEIQFSQQEREVLFVIDNCPAHPVIDNLKSIEIVRLPKNTTAKTQPMDAGVIKQFKGNYRRLLSRKRIHSFDMKIEFSVNILDAINFIHAAWPQIIPSHISNCFRHAGFRKMNSNQLPELSFSFNELDILWDKMVERVTDRRNFSRRLYLI